MTPNATHNIGILAAIALPAYQNYTQRSANTACLGEAKAWTSIRVADIAASTTFVDYSKSACDVGPIKTTKPTEAAKGTASTDQKKDFIAESKLYFSPPTRGTKTEWKAVECDTAAGSCQLVD